MEYLTLENISKTYPETDKKNRNQWTLESISLQVPKGQIVALLGASGCGKTTLLRLITGLESPDTGRIYLNRQEITHTPTHKRSLGMMFQDYALFPHKTVKENIAFGLEINFRSGKKRSYIEERVAEVLALVNLTHIASRYIQDLSGGEKQRVALARTLAPSPKLILLDEPLGALDRALREELMFELRDILKKTNMTAIFVTHDQTEAFSIADKIAVMKEGRIIQLDTPEKLYFSPETKHVAAFLGFKNIFDAVVEEDLTIMTPVGKIAVQPFDFHPGDNVSLLLRPEIAELGGRSCQNGITVSGKLIKVVFLGGQYRITVLLKNGETLNFKYCHQTTLPALNKEISLGIDPEKIVVIKQ